MPRARAIGVDGSDKDEKAAFWLRYKRASQPKRAAAASIEKKNSGKETKKGSPPTYPAPMQQILMPEAASLFAMALRKGRGRVRRSRDRMKQENALNTAKRVEEIFF